MTTTNIDGATGRVPEPHVPEPRVPEPRRAPEDSESDPYTDPVGDTLAGGPLHPETARRVAGAEIAVVATADVHGQRDVAVLYGPACSLRILDAAHLAYPDAGLDPVTASRSNLAEAPDVALLMVAPDGHGGRLGLHVNGTARTVPARELRAERPDLPVQPMPGRPTDVWVVVEVGDAYALDGDDVPPLIPAPAPAPASVPAPASAPPPAPAATSDGRRRGLVVFVLITLVAALVVAVGLSGRRGDGGGGPAATAPPPAAPPVVDPGPSGPATLYGRVLDVTDPGTVVVDVAGRPVTVGVVGLDAATVPPCAMTDSLSFARRTLRGQTVTLVPDPTLPAAPRAYVVLGTQLSYTDAAIRAGWAPAAGAAQYQAVFDGEQRAAQSAGVGMWGPPCRR